MLSFKQALAAAAAGALHAGTISPSGHAAVASFVAAPPSTLSLGIEHIVAHKLGAASIGAVDWVAVFQQLQQMIPMIVALVNLLHPPAPPTPQL